MKCLCGVLLIFALSAPAQAQATIYPIDDAYNELLNLQGTCAERRAKSLTALFNFITHPRIEAVVFTSDWERQLQGFVNQRTYESRGVFLRRLINVYRDIRDSNISRCPPMSDILDISLPLYTLAIEHRRIVGSLQSGSVTYLEYWEFKEKQQ